MKEIQNDSVQNRFTAYLVAAVVHTRASYFHKKQLQKQECVDMDISVRKYTDFEFLHHAYMVEKTADFCNRVEEITDIADVIENRLLIKIVGRLNEREKRILFARIFKEMSFAELGEILDLQPEQAEMAYHYIIRKLRKALGRWKDEF